MTRWRSNLRLVYSQPTVYSSDYGVFLLLHVKRVVVQLSLVSIDGSTMRSNPADRPSLVK
jgi:hypothetical protein